MAGKPKKASESSTAESKPKQKAEIHSFTLRLNSKIISLVDNAVSNHSFIRNRNTWIANAIIEQLKREGIS